ncbi:hypothetical protein [Novosphingobium sp. P6W]|uniref:hypothetical protein n=1 Tax=Novosphingobium sp. P6W TaxID=1609758 RepID=UPI000AE4AE70|nr:hypothetical protein [Novosphingobium sp. P6W]
MTRADIFGGALFLLASLFVIQSLWKGRIATHWPDPGIDKADETGMFWFAVSLGFFAAFSGLLLVLLG